ncbi:methyl-accepting chemotaxis protein [Gammaproteobacteria bacterium]
MTQNLISRLFQPTSLLGKLLGPALLLVTLSLASLGTVMGLQQLHALEASLQSAAGVMADFVAHVSSPYITNYDLTALETFVKELIERDEVAFAEFLDAKGKPLTENVSNPPKDKVHFLVLERKVVDTNDTVLGTFVIGYRLAAIDQERQQAIITVVVGILVALAVISVGLILLARSITRPLRLMAQTMETAEQHGDLTLDIHYQGRDEIGHTSVAFNNLLASLRGTIAAVQNSASSLLLVARKLHEVGEKATHTSNQQTKVATANASAVEQMTASIELVADNAKSVEQQASESYRLASGGSKIAQQTALEIEKIASVIVESSSVVTSLRQQATEIGNIVSMIKGITDQTNLLALNATIEAARAGERGQGFSVVADEVKKLAERTAQATVQISSMITRVQQDTHTAVTNMASANNQVSQGVLLARQVADDLQKIREMSNQSAQKITEIASAIAEQSEACRHLGQNGDKLVMVSDENLHSIHRTTALADELQQTATIMNNLIREFRI